MINYHQNMDKIRDKIKNCDAIVIGAGAGLSTSAGITYSGDRFEKNFEDFIQKYKIEDMYSAAFNFMHYKDLRVKWAYFSRHIKLNRYDEIPKDTYKKLLKLIEDKDYFVITTNADHSFIKSGFDKEKIFYTQGDYGLFQCSVPCHEKTYDNYDIVMKMCETQEDMKIPEKLIPKCPRCGEDMQVNLRIDSTFVEDEGWHKASKRYVDFIQENNMKNIVYLELGVGYNTPGIIKYPFMRYTLDNKNATYININYNQASTIEEIRDRSIVINSDIDKVLKDISEIN